MYCLFIPLIYVSVFVPVQYCFHYCKFAVQFEIRELDNSSFLLCQDCFGYSGSIVFPNKFQNYMFQFCEKCHWYFDKDCIESIHCIEQYGHFNNIDSSNPRTQYIFPSVCVIFHFFHQCLIVFRVQIFYPLVRFIPRYFILFF